MPKTLRLLLLLIVLLWVIWGGRFHRYKLQSWTQPVTIAVHPIATDSRVPANIDTDDLRAINQYLIAQARRFDKSIDGVLQFRLDPVLNTAPPSPPAEARIAEVILWSLHLRWWSFWQKMTVEDADLHVYLRYYPEGAQRVLPHSTGLENGGIALVNVYAAPEAKLRNLVVVTHELLHLFGASDKYNPRTNLPIYPHGYDNPEQNPRFPQRYAEIMGGRIPIAAHLAVEADTLLQTRIGPQTASEIGWR